MSIAFHDKSARPAPTLDAISGGRGRPGLLCVWRAYEFLSQQRFYIFLVHVLVSCGYSDRATSSIFGCNFRRQGSPGAPLCVACSQHSLKTTFCSLFVNFLVSCVHSDVF